MNDVSLLKKRISEFKKEYEKFILDNIFYLIDFEAFKDSFIDWLYCTPEIDELLEFIFKKQVGAIKSFREVLDEGDCFELLRSYDGVFGKK